jgi:2-methylcitrate dehydratase PrpD
MNSSAGKSDRHDSISGATGKDATRKLARHAANCPYEALPSALVELTKLCVLDTLGVSLGATTLAPEARMVTDYVKDFGGNPESTLIGFGGKAPTPWAVFANGSLAHMLDYDGVSASSDGHLFGHLSVATVPVAFAVAEKLGGVSGRDLITAIACGTDVYTRVALSIDIPDWGMKEGWLPSQLLGYLSAAATAGRLLGLNEEQMDNAFGIAFNQMSGSRQMAVGAASHMRSMQTGFSGYGGTMAAQLAQAGLIGSKEILEGRYGLYKTYVRTATPNWEALVGELGTRFSLLTTHGFKIWPSCAFTREVNAAVLSLRQDAGVKPEDVESMTIVGGTAATQLLSEPLELKRRPQSSIDAKFSIPFTAAIMMVNGNVTLRDYSDAGLRDPRVLAMAERISYRGIPAASGAKTGHAAPPGVEILTKDGRTLRHTADGVPGDPANPVDHKRLVEKFRDCVSFAARAPSAANIDRSIEMLADLENIPDATEIVRLLG